MFRRHLRPDTEGLDNPSGEEYCVFTNVFISIGRQVDFRLQVSEVAPAVIDGEPAIIPQCPVDDSTSVLLQGVKLARAIVAKLPAYAMFSDTHVRMWPACATSLCSWSACPRALCCGFVFCMFAGADPPPFFAHMYPCATTWIGGPAREGTQRGRKCTACHPPAAHVKLHLYGTAVMRRPPAGGRHRMAF